jgi:hypothetical protein
MSSFELRDGIVDDNHRSTGEDHYERAEQPWESRESGEGRGMPTSGGPIHSSRQVAFGTEEDP